MLADNQHPAGLIASSHPQQMFQGGQPSSGGAGLAPQGGQGQSNPQMDAMKLNQAVQMDPQSAQKSAEAIRQGLATGLITPQQLQQIIQLAQACMNDPSLWPNIRAFAIKTGLAEDADLPQQYNPALVFSLLLAAKSAEASPEAQNAPQQQGGQPIAAQVQPGESDGGYVIPADVVAHKGRAFFDALIQKHHVPEAMKRNRP